MFFECGFEGSGHSVAFGTVGGVVHLVFGEPHVKYRKLLGPNPLLRRVFPPKNGSFRRVGLSPQERAHFSIKAQVRCRFRLDSSYIFV
jgi:hypothetical protein